MENECRYSNGIGDDHRLLPLSTLKLFPISSPAYSSSSPFSSCSPFSGRLSVGCTNYIEHHVSKFDTLAGVAIKYGVEVADIMKINCLVTDLHMFARKTLFVPLPGRYPPSPNMANDFDSQGTSSSEQTPPSRGGDSDFFNSFRSLKLIPPSRRKESPAMNNLYYGLKPSDYEVAPKECEMTVYQSGRSQYSEDSQFGKPPPHMNPPLSIYRKSKSATDNRKLENPDLANGRLTKAAGKSSFNNWIRNLVCWNQKSEYDFENRAPEMLLKGDTSNGGFSKITGKGLALRQKAASRTASGIDGETGLQSSIITAVEEFARRESLSGVKKSLSLPSFQDSDCTSSIWPAVNWSLKPDLQVFSTVSITRPIFYSCPKSITSRRNKTAVD
ncbi:LysM domain-containing protein [Heracleum sosnowskyi]|uniref:LysM domain-containing protein n=1 Tax=Heracleum sosnowskyi TaxID=360622 RepID=A0AAD8MVX8_9APIA|nr:LysM domain-containing protein [Heracleum sosnowskyi]